MGQVVQTEYGMFLPFIDSQYRQAGGQNIHRKIQPVHIVYIQAQPGKNNILYRSLVGDDDQVLLFPVCRFMQSVNRAPVEFTPGFPAGIIPVIQFLKGCRRALNAFGFTFLQSGRPAIILFPEERKVLHTFYAQFLRKDYGRFMGPL